MWRCYTAKKVFNAKRVTRLEKERVKRMARFLKGAKD
jgi:hypothetical protein